MILGHISKNISPTVNENWTWLNIWWMTKQMWSLYLSPTKMSHLRYWSVARYWYVKNQKIQIPTFMICKASDVQLKNHIWLFCALSWNPLLIQIRKKIVIYVTVLCKPSWHPDALSSILHIRLYAPVDFIHERCFSFIIFNLFSQMYFQTKITYVTMSLRYQNIPWKSKGDSEVFLG